MYVLCQLTFIGKTVVTGSNGKKRRGGKKRKERGYDWIYFDSHLPPFIQIARGATLPTYPITTQSFPRQEKKYVSPRYLFLCMGSYHHCGAAITFPRQSSVMSRFKGGSFFYIIFSFKHHPLAGRIERCFYVLSTKKSQL